MIIDQFLDILASLALFIFSLFPTWELPAWWTSAMNGWGSIVGGIADLAHWVPLQAVTQVAIAVGLVTLFAFTVRALRIILSFVSGGGGA